jgi:hypothetical protein
VSDETGYVLLVASLVAWPAMAGCIAAALRFERGRRRALVFSVIVGVLALSVGLLIDLRSVATGEATAAGAFAIYIGLAFTPPAVAAAQATGAEDDWTWRGLGRRAAAAYGALCLSVPAALIIGLPVGLLTCRAVCL